MDKRLKKYMSMMLVFVLAISFSSNVFAQDSQQDPFDLLREKWFYQIVGGDDFDVSDVDVKAYIEDVVNAKADETYTGFVKADFAGDVDQRPYIWSDLPMVAQIANDRTASSQITLTYDRLKTLALAYNTKGSKYYHDEELKTDIVQALDWMYYHGRRYHENPYIGILAKPQNATTPYGNWYDWEIGTPLRYLDTIILMYDVLTPVQIQDFMKPLDRFSPNVGNNTGANRVWKASIVAESGIIQKRASKLEHAKGAMVEAFTLVKSGDGFYSDGSFVQHSYYPYTGGYGKALLVTIAPLMAILHGSTWELSYEDHLEQKFYDMVFEAYEPLIYNGVMMDMVRNREISRAGGQDHITGRQVIRALITLSGVLPAGQKERALSMLKYFIENDTEKQIYNDPIGWFLEYYVALPHILEAKNILADDSIVSRGELIKHKRYPSMDRVVHLRPGFAFGAAMHSDRVRTYEVVNQEGYNMWHTADGMTYLYNADVKRYGDDFWGTVDHNRLAGTTVVQKTKANNYRSATANPNTWVGGTDMSGLYGVSGMQLSNEVNSKKSWFMFDDEIVALGSGITSTSGHPVETIIENVKLKDDASNSIVMNGTAIPSALGAAKVHENVSWMHLEGNVPGSDAGYYFPSGTSITGKKETRTQSWLLMNTYEKFQDPNPRTKSFATFWLDHGINPVKDKYDYVLLPGKSATETEAYSANPDITIVENSENAHSVQENNLGLFAANFWNDGEYQVGKVKVNKKASVMIREDDETIDISVSDPTQKNTGSVIVDVGSPAGKVLSKDAGITVLQSFPTLKIEVDVNGKAGQSLHMKIARPVAENIPPTAPANVTSKQAGSDYIELQWDGSSDDSGINGYNLYVNDSQTPIFTQDTKYQITGLNPGTLYTIYIRAVDNAGNVSEKSSEIRVTTAIPPPPTGKLITFDDMAVGGSENITGFIFDNSGGYSEIVNNPSGLTKPGNHALKVTSNHATLGANAEIRFGDAEGKPIQGEETIKFKMMWETNVANSNVAILGKLNDGTVQPVVTIMVSGNNLIYKNPSNANQTFMPFVSKKWLEFEVTVNTETSTYSIRVDGEEKVKNVAFRYKTTAGFTLPDNIMAVRVSAPSTGQGSIYADDLYIPEVPPAAHAGVTLIGDDTVAAGGTFQLIYGLENVESEVLAQDATVTYDSDKLEFVSFESLKPQDFMIVDSREADGRIRFLAIHVGSSQTAPNGELMKLIFKAKPGIPSGTADIYVTAVTIANGEGEETELAGATRSVQIRAVDKAALLSLITEAQGVHDAAVEGTAVGNYPAGSKTILQAAIDSARAVAVDAESTQAQVDQAAASLNAALLTFRSSVIVSIPGDVNGDERISIGDLGMIAAAYGKTSADPDWDDHKFADLNNDGVIDIEDLVIIASLILG
jgi:hyaluronate lyase